MNENFLFLLLVMKTN